jgi:hypothetical protein
MRPRLDRIGLDVSDYEASKAFYEHGPDSGTHHGERG